LSGDQYEMIEHKEFNKIEAMCVMNKDPNSYIIATDDKLKKFDLSLQTTSILWEGDSSIKGIS